MLLRCALVGIVLAGCGKLDPPRQQGAAETAKVAPAPAPARTITPPPPPTGLEHVDSNAPADKPVHTSSDADLEELERAIAPYSEQARKSYPDARRRYLKGLPAGYHLSVITKLHSPGHVETVFIAVTGIKGDQITGRIASDIRGVTGYKAGDSYTLSERDLIDWVILAPDGSEEGNVVGKFLDHWQPSGHH